MLKRREPSMTKGRTISWEERIQIVLYRLGNGKNFRIVAETYGVSYQQVYQWVKKYEDVGGRRQNKNFHPKKKYQFLYFVKSLVLHVLLTING